MHDTTFIGLHGVPTTDHLECGLCLVFDITGIQTTFSPYFRDFSEIRRGEGGGNFKFGFGNEVTHPCNGSEIC